MNADSVWQNQLIMDKATIESIMHINQSADSGEIVNPGCITGLHVHTAMAHRRTKIVVPVSSMYAIASIKVHGIGHVRQKIIGAAHIGVAVLHINSIFTGDGRVLGGAGGDHE